MMTVTRISPITGRTNVLDLAITGEQVARWQSGVLLQDAFPNLTAGEREFLKTGITEEEWDSIFGDLEG
jgi:hypothetical protein